MVNPTPGKQIHEEGDLVFAKMKGYMPWPAKVMKRSGGGKYRVKFYGSFDIGRNLKLGDVYKYEEFRYKYQMSPKITKIYKQALREIEHYPEIIGLEEVVDEGISVEMEVEKIVSRKKVERKLHYEVMWKDGSITWEPARNLTNCRLLLRDFLQSVKAGGGVAGLKKLQETSPGQEWERRDAVEERTMVQTESSQRQAGQEQSSIASSTRSYRSKQSKKSPSISPVVLIDHDTPPPVLINNYTPPPVQIYNHTPPPVLVNNQIIPPVLINDQKDYFKLCADPRLWAYEEVVGQLCQMDKKLKITDLKTLIDKKVDGDVLLKCSLDILMNVLKLDFTVAMRVDSQISKMKKTVEMLDVIVIK